MTCSCGCTRFTEMNMGDYTIKVCQRCGQSYRIEHPRKIKHENPKPPKKSGSE